jgi:hypothetical protein
MYLKPESSLQWVACSPNVSRQAIQQTWQTSSLRNNEIMRRYQRNMCWPNPSMEIARRKSWACAAFKYSKTTFYLIVMPKSTSMSEQFYQTMQQWNVYYFLL